MRVSSLMPLIQSIVIASKLSTANPGSEQRPWRTVPIVISAPLHCMYELTTVSFLWVGDTQLDRQSAVGMLY